MTRSTPPTAPRRTFLFLQGLASPFFVRLARALGDGGHAVRRININLGDELFWSLPATGYRGSLAGWRNYLGAYLVDHDVTDIVLFGDCRPYHRVAIGIAAHRRIQVHVCEEGYLRPHWITLERGGVNGSSSLPRDPNVVRTLAADIQAVEPLPIRGSFARRALWDVVYNMACVFGRPLYPRYRRYRPQHVFVEYAGWIRRFWTRRPTRHRAKTLARRALGLAGGYYLVPLQLESDYQIRVHSRFTTLDEILEEVCRSFALQAPAESELLVKIHPLDNGLVDRVAAVAAIAERHGIGSRVTCIQGGDLTVLLAAARGVVVVNSTVGTTALEAGRPTIALGNAIYNMPGLTFQNGLDHFWTEATPPEPDLVADFRRLVIHRTQLNGGFFCRPGLARAVETAVARIEATEPLLTFFTAEDAITDPTLYASTQPAE